MASTPPPDRRALWRSFAVTFGVGAAIGFVFALLFIPHYLEGRRPAWLYAVASGVALLTGGAAASQADAFWEGIFEGSPEAERRFRRWVVVALLLVGVAAAIGVFVVGRYGFPKV